MRSSWVGMTSGHSVHLRALPTGAFEIWISRLYRVAALLAEKPPRRVREHLLEIVTEHAIGTSNDFVSHFETFGSFSRISPAIRFDPGAFCLARALRQEPFRANVLGGQRPPYPRIRANDR